MDYRTRNETIRALAAATAAAIRINPRRAVAALLPVSGEIERGATVEPLHVVSTDRDLPIERTPNRYTGEHREAAEGGVE